ncbi:MAG: ribosomal protein L11 methyltransferase [Cytophagaceae bacterium SCN 52-12]|nr:MAG: ribosomal protein L11 methyltransferase [Cytophagaceae bacterium SCN 52-12]
MNYIELSLEIDPEYVEILIAELAEIDYESFVETDEGVNAYIEAPRFDQVALHEVIAKYEEQTAIAFSVKTLEKENWNKEWESNYETIEVEDKVRVRASFHEPDPSFPYELLINPKMSFGTGHHETTRLVMSEQLSLPHEGADLMDVGSGTGILGILGKKLGAETVLAFDIEEWAVENAKENVALNNVSEGFEVFLGTIGDVGERKGFDGILANINRNILLQEMESYSKRLKAGGWMVISGFYRADAPGLIALGEQLGLKLLRTNYRNDWAAVSFMKL